MSAPEANGDDGNPPPDVDTTLLESLFYNEMMMLDDSSELLSTVTGLVGEANANIPPPPIFRAGSSKKAAKKTTATAPPVTLSQPPGKEQTGEDPHILAEQSLLQDFGVTDSPFPHLSERNTGQNTAGKPSNKQPPPHKNPPEIKPYPPPQHPHVQQTQDPNRYPPQQQYHHPNQHYHHHASGHHYPPNSHPAPAGAPQNTYQSAAHQLPPIQPRPSPPSLNTSVSKGIKHSVTPHQSPSPPGTQKLVQTLPSPTTTIPNPLANQNQSQPPHSHGHPHPQQHPPPYHAHPPHQAPPQHTGQPAYHYRPPPHASAPPPPLVPVPAPAPGHHPQSAYGPPPPHGSSQAPYGAGSPPTAGHPTLHVAHHHPHPHAHPHTPAAPGSHPHPQHAHPFYAHAQPPKEQLVSQFATLANRLGINLPNDLLSSLTKSAGMVSANVEPPTAKGAHPHYATAGPPVPFVNHNGQTPQATYAPRPVTKHSTGEKSSVEPTPAPSDASAPEVQALRKTAEDAIAAVTRKRSHDDSSKATVHSDSKDSNKPSYAKRRKKPRMQDCESRLAQLRAENEKLKRHLDNITNRTEKFQQDRIKAEITMKQMMENNDTPDEELDEVIREYSEAYSDYGRRRHEELSFHLEQLQKLANPTNFTKMALWTIAKANDSKDLTKQNPLIGILQKELNISPPQVRKILEQRQKIRDLCSNMNSTLELIHQLKELCEQKNKKFNDRMNKTREMLTPKQVVKLIMWIKDYSDVLGSICPGWTSEQVVKDKASLDKKPPKVDPVKSSTSTNEESDAGGPTAAKEASDSEVAAGNESAKAEGQS